MVTTSSFEPQESGLGNTSNNTTNCVKELSGGDKNTILCSEEFKLFLGDTARVIERALNERSVFDILLDYRFFPYYSFLKPSSSSLFLSIYH